MNRPPRRGLLRGTQIALLALACAATAAEGQQERTVARLKSVVGNVLVSQQSGLAAGSEAQRLSDGTRVITTTNSTAVVQFDNGCEVEMKENQRFEVDSSQTCVALLALAQGIVPQAAVGPLFMGALPAGAAAGGFGAILDSREIQAVSPN